MREDICDKNTKSGLAKGVRALISTDVQAFERKRSFPEAATYKVDWKLVEPNLKQPITTKSDRLTYVDDARFVGRQQAPWYDPDYKLVDQRSPSPKYITPAQKNGGPLFIKQAMKDHEATKGLSPASYTTMDAYKRTCAREKFIMLKKPRVSLAEEEAKKKKWIPGAGTYDIKSIEKGFKALSTGGSKRLS